MILSDDIMDDATACTVAQGGQTILKTLLMDAKNAEN